MNHLTGKTVEIEAHGITYTGVLKEINETETYLETESGWIVISNNDIASMQEKND
ncbi:hypothetical protein BMS3Abin07_01596 [bacterium BMS3Abin07]|nr:hypothetical protein BMS3Abin07_01596 [bacterium BMS3Abin07]